MVNEWKEKKRREEKRRREVGKEGKGRKCQRLRARAAVRNARQNIDTATAAAQQQ